MRQCNGFNIKLESWESEEMPHDGLISFWERKTPGGKNYHLYYERAVGSKGKVAGMYSFTKERDRNKAMLRLCKAWESQNLPFITPQSVKNLEAYQAFRNQKQAEKQEKGDLAARLAAIQSARGF